MPCGWEGNRRSGVALAMRHRLQWFIYLWAHGPRKGDEPTLLTAYGTIHLYLACIIAAFEQLYKTEHQLVYMQYNTVQYEICKAPCWRGFRGAGEQDS